MKDEDKTKEQLIYELMELRQRITELEVSETLRERAENALQKSELQYRSTLDSMVDFIHVIDTDLRFTLFNNAFKQINIELGLKTDVMGKKILDVFPFLSDNVLNEYKHVFETGKPFFTEEKITISGREFLTETRKVPIFDEKKVTHIVTVIRDVTKRKLMENAVRNSEKRFRELAELLPETIFEIDLEGNLAFANRIAFDTFGYSQEDFDRGINAFQCIAPEDLVRLKENISRICNGEDTGINEYVAQKKDGSRLPVIIRSNVIRDDGGNPIGLRGIIIDITERKKAEEKIREYTEKLEVSEMRYRGLYESSIDGIVSRDLEGYIVDCNQAFANMLGYTKEELYKFPHQKLIPSKLSDSLKKFIEEQLGPRGYSDEFEIEYVKKDGTFIPASVRVWSIKDKDGNSTGTWAIVRDITERKKLERKLVESEEKYRTLVEKDPNMIYLIKDGKVIFANQAVVDTLDYSREELYELDLDLLLPIIPEQRQIIRKRLKKRLAGEQVPESYEFSVLTKSGERIPCLLNTTSFEIEGTRVIQGVLTDIRKVKELEKKLKKSEERYRGLYESSIDGIVSLDLNGRIIESNQAFADMLGYSKEELRKFTIFDITPSKWRDMNKKFHELLLKGAHFEEFKKEYIKKDGTIVPVAIRGWGIKDKEGKSMGMWGVVRDITEKQKLEEERFKVEKLESLGILAGGIAHDFNNILTGILGNISLAKQYTCPEDKLFERLIEAEKASMRAKDLTHQLLTFSKGGTPIKKIASIKELLKDTSSFALSGSNVRCEFSFPENLWLVEIDESQISQVINNLIINADQAMPEGGIITICAENVIIGTKNAMSHNKGSYVKISIQDQGIGIPKEHLSKIFDPYFTTKHKGSGLGLAVVYSIIKNHDGKITVDSELGVGSTFSIYLPASSTQTLTKKEAEKNIVTGKGKILVMDDEEVIRNALDEILSYLGYHVEFSRNGEGAIDLYKKARNSGVPFDAVIMDLTIRGGMGGEETIQQLIEIDPEVKAIVSSGYSNDPIMAEFEKYGFSGVVAKPYDLKELSEALHRLINER